MADTHILSSFHEAQDVLARFMSDEKNLAQVQKFVDVFLAITTSGNSQNLVLAAEAAKKKGMKVVGLLGKGGGKIAPLCDIPIIVPGQTSDRIQELHIKIIHIAIECAERRLFPELY